MRDVRPDGFRINRSKPDQIFEEAKAYMKNEYGGIVERVERDRINIHEYYMLIAEAAAQRSTCDRAKVGCVLVQDNHILDTGYNGSLPKYPHCDKKTCYYEGRCIRTTHAEVNCLKRAIESGNIVEDATLYSTHRPCYSCMTVLAAFGIKEIYYRNIYDDPKALAYANLVDIRLIQVENKTEFKVEEKNDDEAALEKIREIIDGWPHWKKEVYNKLLKITCGNDRREN